MPMPTFELGLHQSCVCRRLAQLGLKGAAVGGGGEGGGGG